MPAQRPFTNPCTRSQIRAPSRTRPCTFHHKTVHLPAQGRAPFDTRPCTFGAGSSCGATGCGDLKRIKLLKLSKPIRFERSGKAEDRSERRLVQDSTIEATCHHPQDPRATTGIAHHLSKRCAPSGPDRHRSLVRRGLDRIQGAPICEAASGHKATTTHPVNRRTECLPPGRSPDELCRWSSILVPEVDPGPRRLAARRRLDLDEGTPRARRDGVLG